MFPIDNEIIRHWLTQVFHQVPFDIESLSTCGSGPYAENDFDLLLNGGGFEIYPINPDNEILIIGRNFPQDEDQEAKFLEILEIRQGATYRIYSQEMFLAHWFSGSDPFENPDVLGGFREGHPGLEFVSSRWLNWGNTHVSVSASNRDSIIEAPEIGILKHMGYQVGKTRGLMAEARQTILTKIFNGNLPFINSQDYMEEWGKPGSSERLKKMVDSMSSFCRNQKLAGNVVAVSHYEEDLEWLKREYYTGRFRFRWSESHID